MSDGAGRRSGSVRKEKDKQGTFPLAWSAFVVKGNATVTSKGQITDGFDSLAKTGRKKNQA